MKEPSRPLLHDSLQASSSSSSMPPAKTTRQHSDSCDSTTSATVLMNQNMKQRILKNHLRLIIFINVIQLSAIVFSIIWPPWYDDTAGQVEGATVYGLLLTFSEGHITVNGFENENNKEIGGISTFVLFTVGASVQFLQLLQLLRFSKRYPNNSDYASSNKILKYKTCRRITLFFYLSAVCYWVVVVFLVQVVSDADNFSQLQYGFWVALASIAIFFLVSIYFNFLKKNIRKNDLVINLLLANNNSDRSSRNSTSDFEKYDRFSSLYRSANANNNSHLIGNSFNGINNNSYY